RSPRFTNFEPSINKKPQRVTGAPRSRWMRQCYILGLQVLPLASHTPPALVQSAFVFAVVTSAANVGAVTANARPKATVTQTSVFIGTSPPRNKLPLPVAHHC